MRINSLTVKNFKGFEGATFEFPERFTLIVGENGTGKTSILEAIALVLGTCYDWGASGLGKYWSSITGNDLQNAHESSTFDPFESCALERRTVHGNEVRFERQSSNSIEVFAESDLVNWLRLDQTGIKTEMAPEATDHSAFYNLIQSTGRRSVVAWYSSSRLPQQRCQREIQRPTNRPRPEQAYNDCCSGTFSIDSVMEWVRKQQYASIQEGRESLLLKAVTGAMKECLQKASRVFYQIRDEELLVEFQNSDVQPFRNLSDGQRMLLWMVADIAYRAAWLNPQLEDRVLQDTDGIVLIDELDLHLHPKWQRTVIDNLKRTFPKVQFIATSHSPFLIQSLRPGELLSLDGEPLIDYSNSGLEEIARFIQGVDTPHTSQRYTDQKAAAKRYFTMLREGRSRDDKELLKAKSELDSLTSHFSNNPAAEAFFELQRAAQIEANGIRPSSQDSDDSEDPQVEASSS